MQKEMNPLTLVTVHGYYGDSAQIRNALRYYEHHGCSVVIMSPTDSPIQKMGPHICRFAGKRAYIGQLSIDRQYAQMRAMLDYPFEFFLANDSDSICISPKIPEYLYETPGVLWSNEVSDLMHQRKADYKWPRMAFQPPYFFSRSALEAMLATEGKFETDQQTPFIDWLMMAICHAGNIPHANYRDGVSCPTSDGHSRRHMSTRIANHGAVMLHSIKTPIALQEMVSARYQYNRTQGRGISL
jgi:hypothetical protein